MTVTTQNNKNKWGTDEENSRAPEGCDYFVNRTRNDKEIDFVTRRGTKVEIQVCYDMTSEKTRKRELDAIVEAAEEFHCDNLLVITNDQEAQIEWKGEKISAISISHF